MKKLLIALALVALLILGFYTYMGGFHRVEVAQSNLGPLEVVFTTYKGPYSGLMKSWEDWAKEKDAHELGDLQGLAFYFDPPGTPEAEQRTILAYDIGELSPDKKAEVQQEMKVFRLPQIEVYRGQFPFKNLLSYMMAPMKVYPKVAERLGEGAAGVAIEVYKKKWIEVNFYNTEDRSQFNTLLQAFN